ncbi:MAG: tetratricopeptide repeat protein [bacterium]|nr:tetratricopeptide repeat protein [bacterium]
MKIVRKNKPPLDVHGEDEELLQRNRISAIKAEERDFPTRKKQILIISLVALTAVLGVLLVVIIKNEGTTFFNKTAKPGEKGGPIERINNNITIGSNNVNLVRGKESYSKGYLNDAVSEFQSVVESGAEDRDKNIALTFLGMISHDRGKYQEALEFYERALKYYDKNPDTYRNRGLSFRALEKFDKAAKNLHKALELNSGDVNSRIILGNIYFNRAQYDNAIKEYTIALELSPGNPSVLYNKGSSLLKKGDELSGIDYLRKAAEASKIGDIAHSAYSRLGLLFMEKKNYDLAEQYLRKAILIDPRNAVYRYNLGITYLRQEKTAKALKEFEEAEKIGDMDTRILENIGQAYYSMNSYDRSLGVYNQILETNKRNVRILSKVGDIYYEKGELDKAHETFSKITELEPLTENARIAYINIGNIMDDAGKFDDAIKAYEKSITISPKDDAVHYNIGLAYKHAGKPELALKAWEKASKLNTSDPKPLVARANYYYEEGLYEPAMKEFRDVQDRWPNTQEAQEALYKIGLIHNKKGKLQYALNAFNKVLQINAKNDLAVEAYINIAVLSANLDISEKGLQQAQENIAKSLLLKPGHAQALLSLGLIYSKKEMYDKAIDTLKQALENSRDNEMLSKIYNNLGTCFYNKKDYKNALRFFDRGVAEEPTNEEIRINRKAAMEAYEKELSLD